MEGVSISKLLRPCLFEKPPAVSFATNKVFVSSSARALHSAKNGSQRHNAAKIANPFKFALRENLVALHQETVAYHLVRLRVHVVATAHRYSFETPLAVSTPTDRGALPNWEPGRGHTPRDADLNVGLGLRPVWNRRTWVHPEISPPMAASRIHSDSHDLP